MRVRFFDVLLILRNNVERVWKQGSRVVPVCLMREDEHSLGERKWL